MAARPFHRQYQWWTGTQVHRRYQSIRNGNELERRARLGNLQTSVEHLGQVRRSLHLDDRGPKFPPHIAPGDWFNNPRNKKWVSWKPLVEKWWKEKLAAVAGPAPQVAQDGAALHELTRLVSQLANNNGKSAEGDKLSAVLIQWALQQTADERKSEREADSPGKLAEMIRAMKELAPPAAAPAPVQDNTMMTFVLSQLTRLQESNDKLMGLLLSQKANENKPADPLAQVETMAKLIATVSGIVQPAAPKEWYQDLAETLGPRSLTSLHRSSR